MPAASPPASREQVLEYLGEMLLELAALADSVEERTLGAGIRLLAEQASRALGKGD